MPCNKVIWVITVAVKVLEMALAGLDGHFRGRCIALLCSKGYTECTKHNASGYYNAISDYLTSHYGHLLTCTIHFSFFFFFFFKSSATIHWHFFFYYYIFDLNSISILENVNTKKY